MKKLSLFLILAVVLTAFAEKKMVVHKATEKVIYKISDIDSITFIDIDYTNVVAHYTFDGNFNDISGNENNASANGAAILSEDRHGNANSALKLDGVEGSYVANVAPSNMPNGNVAKSISVWFKIDSDSTTYNSNFEYFCGLGPLSPPWDTKTFALGTLYGKYHVAASGSSSDWKTGIEVTGFNEWHNAVVTYDGTTTTLYIDGTEAASTSSNTFNTQADKIYIGCNVNLTNGWDFNGSLDDIFIYNKALTADDVSDLYQQ